MSNLVYTAARLRPDRPATASVLSAVAAEIQDQRGERVAAAAALLSVQAMVEAALDAYNALNSLLIDRIIQQLNRRIKRPN